jgi:hypothetical protein
MYVDAQMFARIVDLYRAQPSSRRPNHLQVSKLTGIDRRTLTGGYLEGWPRTRNRPELPPIKTILDAEELAAVSPAAEAPTAESVAAATPAAADASATSPAVATAVMPAPAVPVDPVEILREAATKALLQELEILKAARGNAIGLLVTSQIFLKALHDSAPTIRQRLVALASDKPEKAIALLSELARIESETVRSAERLVATQRVIAGLPSTITEHRVAPHTPERTPEELARVSVAVLEAIGRMDDREDGVIEVEATS